MPRRLNRRELLPQWQYGFCSCLEDVNLCLDTIFCFPCNIGRQFDAVESGKVDSMNFFVCLAGTLSNLLSTVGAVYIRFQVRYRFEIDESWFITLFAPILCFWCSLAQTYRELNARGLWPGGTCCIPEMMTAPEAEPMARQQDYGATE